MANRESRVIKISSPKIICKYCNIFFRRTSQLSSPSLSPPLAEEGFVPSSTSSALPATSHQQHSSCKFKGPSMEVLVAPSVQPSYKLPLHTVEAMVAAASASDIGGSQSSCQFKEQQAMERVLTGSSQSSCKFDVGANSESSLLAAVAASSCKFQQLKEKPKVSQIA